MFPLSLIAIINLSLPFPAMISLLVLHFLSKKQSLNQSSTILYFCLRLNLFNKFCSKHFSFNICSIFFLLCTILSLFLTMLCFVAYTLVNACYFIRLPSVFPPVCLSICPSRTHFNLKNFFCLYSSLYSSAHILNLTTFSNLANKFS